jgi:uncharacterized alpha-E superfamily protein
MISRVAEHCYWMARYLERAENTARILEVNQTLLLDLQVPIEEQWTPLLIISGIHEYEEPPTAENVQDFMTWDTDNPFSIVTSLWWARENARIIREVISAEMWERMNYYHLWLQKAESRELFHSNRGEFYAQIRRINQLLSGISNATMSHSEPWQFVRLGRSLERASQTARILDVKYHTLLPKVEDVGTPIDNAHWMAILMSCSAYEPFHKNAWAMTETANAVVEFLMFDDDFPRSVHHCLSSCQRSLRAIAGYSSTNPIHITPADEQVNTLLEWLDSRGVKQVMAEGLHESLTHVVDGTHEIGNAIMSTYFAPTTVSQD